MRLRDVYRFAHYRCPRCWCDRLEQNDGENILCLGSLQDGTYRNYNKTWCGTCGWKGTVHDRVAMILADPDRQALACLPLADFLTYQACWEIAQSLRHNRSMHQKTILTASLLKALGLLVPPRKPDGFCLSEKGIYLLAFFDAHGCDPRTWPCQ